MQVARLAATAALTGPSSRGHTLSRRSGDALSPAIAVAASAPYIDKYEYLRHNGETVVIDGMRLKLPAPSCSARVLARSHLCHAARQSRLPCGMGFRSRRPTGHQFGGDPHALSDLSARIQRWIARRGGLKPDMIFLRGRELAGMYKPCYTEAQGRRPRTLARRGYVDAAIPRATPPPAERPSPRSSDYFRHGRAIAVRRTASLRSPLSRPSTSLAPARSRSHLPGRPAYHLAPAPAGGLCHIYGRNRHHRSGQANRLARS